MLIYKTNNDTKTTISIKIRGEIHLRDIFFEPSRSWSSVNFQIPSGGGEWKRGEGRNKGRSPPPLLRSGSPRWKRFVKGKYTVLGANNGGIGYTLFARRVRDKNPGPGLLFAAGRAPSPLPLLPSHSLSYVPVVTDPETWPVIGPSLAQ